MALIERVTSIHIDNKLLNGFKETKMLLDTLTNEFEDLAKDEDRYRDLYELACSASSAIDDFLQAYAERNL